MKTFQILALAGAVAANPIAQAVTSAIAPKESTPAGCSTSYDGEFEITTVNVTSSKRAAKNLLITLKDGKLIDDSGRTGYIASNNQFQFDAPVQAGAIYTAGWSVCSNGSLALGNSAIFYACLSGTFYNLYDESTGAQCSPIYIDVIAQSGSSSTTAAASALSDGQVTASPVSQISDGQPQATSANAAVSQISDGQIQATTAATAAPVSQISDGQIQATTAGTAHPVSQISDGQIQATSAAAAVSQISDGQIQAATAAAVSQISDGQIQAATAAATTAAPITQISDGQIQAPAATGNVVSQISDGQIQAATNGTGAYTSASATVQAFTGAAALPTMRAELFGLAAGVLALAAF